MLYGLKQDPIAWYERLDKHLLDQVFQKGSTNNNLCFKVESSKILIVIVYVDDIIFGGNDDMCKKFASEMK